MLQDIVKEYIDSEKTYGEERTLHHYNCAETLLNSCNDYYKLGLDPKAKKMAVPFGGGLYKEKTCGVLTGGLMAIGVLFAEDKPTDQATMKAVTREFVERFEQFFGSTDCAAIKESHRHPQGKCAPVMMAGAALLEEILKERSAKGKERTET